MEKPYTFSPLPDNLSEILETGITEPHEVSPQRRVYTNTDLDLSTVKVVGFDMDYTLAVYHKEAMEQLQYDLTVARLIEHMGYPKDIAELTYDPSFIVRGLTVDKRTGTLFKMDAQGAVVRCFSGRRPLPKEEYVPFYRNASSRISSEDFATLDTLFAMPEACLYANLVDHFTKLHDAGKKVYPLQLVAGHETANLGNINTWKLFSDVRKSIDDIHRDGSLKSTIMADLEKYIEVDEKLALTLHKLRSSGKKLFLLTNSYWLYTDTLMQHLLGDRLKEYTSWRSYFDVVIVGGRKPGFFAAREPFLVVDTETPPFRAMEDTGTGKFDKSKVYQHGNQEIFEQRMAAFGPEVLYVGDHIFGDILRSKKDSGWRTCFVVEELEDEIDCVVKGRETLNQLAQVDEARHRMDDDIGEHRAILARIELTIAASESLGIDADAKAALTKVHKALKKEIDEAKRVLRRHDQQVMSLYDELDKSFNPYWGRLLKAKNELSRFGSQMRGYADTYTSRVTNLLQYSPVHYFRAPRDLMSHDYVLADSRGLTNVRRTEEGDPDAA